MQLGYHTNIKFTSFQRDIWMVLILFIVYVPVTVQINKKLRSESFNLTQFKHQPRLLFYFGRNSSGSMQSSCTLRSYPQYT